MRLGLVTILILSLGSHANKVIANAISSLSVRDNAIVITVPTTVVGGDDEMVARWERAIERAWNSGNDGGPFVVCNRAVRFEPVFARQASAPTARKSHLVIVETVPDNRTFVSSVSYALGTSPLYSPRAGSWASNMEAQTVAHEFGHLLGLLDEYLENDVNKNGHREPGEAPHPDLIVYPDASFSLMAVERGAVLPRHVREIVRMHGGEHLLSCR